MAKSLFVYYEEVPEETPSAEVFEAAHEMRRFVEAELNLPPLKIRWFVERHLSALPWSTPDEQFEWFRSRPGERHLNTNNQTGIQGKFFDDPVLACDKELRNTIWVRTSLRRGVGAVWANFPAIAAQIVAHEARHIFQMRNLDLDDGLGGNRLEVFEHDAQAYAQAALRLLHSAAGEVPDKTL